MNASVDPLDPQTHARILEEKIARQKLLGKAAHEHPKAIILGGQPGAGKGGLADSAKDEFHGDVVTIDPDDLRDYHPRINAFRAANPYTWSGRTHADASQWADELRQAATDGRKNFIFDTTLSHGEWTAELIKDLQSKGYDVEVRAVVAHKLESEWGVDNRFSKQIDTLGHGRYVPAGARDAIYDKVPAGLDVVHARTDAPIRLFNREGREIYDSRSDVRSPGQVLNEARQARLDDPHVTRSLHAGYRQQLDWHAHLPEALSHSTNVAPQTAQRLLVERSEWNVVEGVQRDAKQAASLDYTVRVHPSVLKGVGIVGAAATVYDATTTASQTANLLHQGNTVGAQSTVEHFAGRNLGGWTGTAVGAEALGALGIESGPGDVLVAAAGGVGGALAGDRLAAWRDQQRVYTQTDPHGQPWHYDPAKPQQGWTSELPPVPGSGQTGMQHLTASPALADRLSYQASSASVELALANPASPRDPYTQPAGPYDARLPDNPPWKRDPQTQQWSRTYTDAFVERGMSHTTSVPATLGRAAQLDAAAQQTVAENLTNSPHGMAERYQMVYAQRGWQQFGPMPEAVSNALKIPDNTLQASDDKTYTRGADGQWTTPSLFYGRDAATGNVRDELNATYASAQAKVAESLHPVPVETAHGASAVTPHAPQEATSPPVDEHARAEAVRGSHSPGKAHEASSASTPSRLFLELSAKISRVSQAMETGDRAAALKEVQHVYASPAWKTAYERASAKVAQEDQQRAEYRAKHPRDPRDTTHPDHALHEGIRQQVISLHTQAGIFPTGEMIRHLTANVARDARGSGMDRVDQLHFNADRTAVIAEQKSGPHNVMSRIATTNIQQAMQTPPEHAYQQMAQETQRQSQIQQAVQQQIAQSRQGPALGR